MKPAVYLFARISYAVSGAVILDYFNVSINLSILIPLIYWKIYTTPRHGESLSVSLLSRALTR